MTMTNGQAAEIQLNDTDSGQTTPAEEKKARGPRGVPATKGPHVFTAICQVKQALAKHGGISKDRTAPVGGGYAFRGIDDMYNTLCGLTADVGLVMMPRVVGDPRIEFQENKKNGNIQTHVFFVVEVDYFSAQDGSHCLGRYVGEAIDSGDKSANKAMSAAMKYACLMPFQIPTAGGDDTEAYDVEVGPREAPPPPKSAPRTTPTPTGPGLAKTTAPAPVKPPAPEELEQHTNMLQAVSSANSFKLLSDLAVEVDTWAEPGRAEVYQAIRSRVVALCTAAPNLPALADAAPLIQALGAPIALKRAYNERLGHLRQPQELS